MDFRRFRPLVCMLAAALLCLFGMNRAAKAEETDTYGDDAYYYMEYLQTNYPNRAVAYPNLDYAAAWLKERITEMGYDYAGQPFSVQSGENIINGENIIFSKPGADSRVIVVGAHYDSVLTNGTDDNATGVGLLLETANRLSAGEMPPYTVRFILFSAEEPGCIGSQYYVDSLSEEERQNILCMINIDTIGAGDFMYLYGGGLDQSGQAVRTWVVEQALDIAGNMGLAMSAHPDVNPEFPVPTKRTASDQQAFDRAGIPYLYLEASNWNGGPYTNFYQTDHPAVENGKMMHVAAYENLAFYSSTFGSRIYDHLKAYSRLVHYLLYHIVPDAGAAEYEFEERDETVWAVADVRIRKGCSLASEVLDVLKEGESIRRTGSSGEWSRVAYDSGQAYIKSEYLTEKKPEETSEEETLCEESSSEAQRESREETSSEEDIILERESGTEEEEQRVLQTRTEETLPVQQDDGMKVITQTVEQPKNGGTGLDTVLETLKSSAVLRCAVIAGIIAAALLLCAIVFAVQHRHKK